MSIITKIRNRAGLLVAMIGLAILSFLMMDVFSGNGIFSNRPANVAGEIDGTEIGIQQFENRVQEAIENYKANTQQDKIDEATIAMLRDQVWNELVREQLVQQEYAAIGLGVGIDELFDMVQGTNIHPSVRQAFSNPQTGQFDRAQVVSFIRNLDQQPEDMQKRWSGFEKYIKQERETQKYNMLLAKGLYVPSVNAKRSIQRSSTAYEGRFILLDYALVADSSVSISDADLKAYYKKNSADYEQKEANRAIEFVAFDVQPSADDSSNARKFLEEMAADFAATENDSLFVSLQSDLPYNDSWTREDALMNEYEKQLFTAETGTTTEIFIDGNYYKMMKLVARSSRPDSVRARHILIPVENGDELAAKAKADSLKALVDGGADFAALAKANSTDAGSAEKGGDLGFFAEGMMVKPFNDACFNGNKGDVVLVQSQFGFHIINITDKKGMRPAVKLATNANEIQPSTETYREVFAKANKFQGENRTAEAFNTAIEENGLVKRTAENIKIGDRSLPGFTNAREIVRWVYKAEVGDVSNTFELDDRYVVAVLTKASEKGVRPFEEVKSEIEVAVRRDKKAEKLLADARAGIEKANGDIEAAARNLNNVIQRFNGANFESNFMPAMGREMTVLGKISKAEKGKLLAPIKGERGVYVVQLDAITENPANGDVESIKRNMSAQYSSRVQNEALNALKESVTVEDLRHNFY